MGSVHKNPPTAFVGWTPRSLPGGCPVLENAQQALFRGGPSQSPSSPSPAAKARGACPSSPRPCTLSLCLVSGTWQVGAVSCGLGGALRPRGHLPCGLARSLGAVAMSSSSFPSPDGRPLTPQPRFWVEMLHRGFSAPRHFPWELKLLVRRPSITFFRSGVWPASAFLLLEHGWGQLGHVTQPRPATEGSLGIRLPALGQLSFFTSGRGNELQIAGEDDIFITCQRSCLYRVAQKVRMVFSVK